MRFFTILTYTSDFIGFSNNFVWLLKIKPIVFFTVWNEQALTLVYSSPKLTQEGPIPDCFLSQNCGSRFENKWLKSSRNTFFSCPLKRSNRPLHVIESIISWHFKSRFKLPVLAMKPIGYPALNELPLSYYTQDGDGGRRLYKRINITLEWLIIPLWYNRQYMRNWQII